MMKARMTGLTLIAAALMIFISGCGKADFRWKGEELLYRDGQGIGRISATYPEGIASKYSIKDIGSGTYRVEWSFTAKEDVDSARISIDFIHNSHSDYWVIPAVSYNGNFWGKGKEPKGASENGIWRTYSFRRTPIPGAVYSEGKRFAVASWSDIPAREDEYFSCCVMPEDSTTTHRLIWPEEEMPVTYFNRDRSGAGWQRHASLGKGSTIKIGMYLSVSEVREYHRSMEHFLTNCWKNSVHPSFSVPSEERIWEYGVEYFKKSLWAEDGIFRGFSIGLLPDSDGKGWHQRPSGKYESGWCGQNISVGCSLLWDWIKNSDRESLEKGLAVLDCWADNCRLPNGLFITQFDAVLNGKECNLDACNLGTTALNYFQAAQLAEQCGYERPQYLDLAYDILDFAIADQQENGCYARGWRFDGSCIYREGTVGCFLLPAMLEAYRQSSDRKYLESAFKAYRHYIEQLHTDGFATAGALDTWCIDKESAISLLRSALGLFRITGEKEYLDDAVQVSCYLSSWMWHYDGIYPDDDQFTLYDYHTFGGTSVSAQHHHLDYYATLWIPEWIELGELTGDEQWLEKARAIWNNSCQLISDGSFEINGRTRPFGSQNEAYFESSWGFGISGSTDGRPFIPPCSRTDRINDWLVAWPSAFRLETLRKLEQSGKLERI